MEHTLEFVSAFTGVGGIDLGLERTGRFRCVMQAETEPRRRMVLRHRFPGVPVCPDVRLLGVGQAATTTIDDDEESPTYGEPIPVPNGRWYPGRVDGAVGGFPCQDVSVAGRRRGLAGRRSGLFFEFARVADELVRPGGFVLIENVPGLLSSHGGRDFAVVLATLADIGFQDLAWRVLDSRHFGVPQRRRRVYILGRRARGGFCSQVLLELDGSRGDPAARREAWTRPTDGAGPGAALAGHLAATLTRGSHGTRPPGRRLEDDVNLAVVDDRSVGERIDAGDLTRAFTAKTGRAGRAGIDLDDAESNWLVPERIARPLLAGSPGAGLRTTDVDTGTYVVRADGEGVVDGGHGGSDADGPAGGRGPDGPGLVGALDGGTGIEGDGSRASRLVVGRGGAGDSGDAGGAGRDAAGEQGRGPVGQGADGVCEAPRGQRRRGPRDVGGGGDGPDAQLDGPGGDERGAGGDAGGPGGDAADGGRRGAAPDADGVRAPAEFPRRVDGRAVESGSGAAGVSAAELSCISGDAASGYDGISKVDSIDADGVARKRDAGLGVISDGSAYTIKAQGKPPAVGPVEAPQAFLPRHYTRGKDGAPSDVVPPLTEDMDRGDGHPMTYGFTSTLGSLDADGIQEDATPPVMARTPPAACYPSDAPGEWTEDDVTGVVRTREGRSDGTLLLPGDRALAERLEADGYLPPVPFDPAPDGPRYSAMGDAVTVNVVHWIAAGIVAELDARGGDLYALEGIS